MREIKAKLRTNFQCFTWNDEIHSAWFGLNCGLQSASLHDEIRLEGEQFLSGGWKVFAMQDKLLLGLKLIIPVKHYK